MSDIKQRIYENIHADAINHIKHGTPMPDRGVNWAEETTNAVAAAALIYKPIVKGARKGPTREERLRKLQEKRARNSGMSWDEWTKICRSRYLIDEVTFVVTSIANGPDHGRTWPCGDQYEADSRVYKLMYYTEYDHHIREGSDTVEFRYNPLEPKDA